MHQGRGLQGLAGLFLSQSLGGKLAKLVIDQGQKLLGGFRVALLDRREDLGNDVHGRRTEDHPSDDPTDPRASLLGSD